MVYTPEWDARAPCVHTFTITRALGQFRLASSLTGVFLGGMGEMHFLVLNACFLQLVIKPVLGLLRARQIIQMIQVRTSLN